jgi:hypothetical protein
VEESAAAAMAMAFDDEQRVADAREQEALEDAHRQRVAASIAASAARRFEQELRQAPEASEGERGAVTESEGHAPHDGDSARPDTMPTPPTKGRRWEAWMDTTAEAKLAQQTPHQRARMLAGIARITQARYGTAPTREAEAGTMPNGELPFAEEGQSREEREALLSCDLESTASTLGSAALRSHEDALAARTPGQRARMEAGIARCERALYGTPSQAGQRTEHAADESLARALQGSLEISHPPERLSGGHIEAARRLGMRSAGMTWLLEAEAATAANSANRAPNEAPGNLSTTSPSKGQAW